MNNQQQFVDNKIIGLNITIVKLRREKRRILLYTISPDDGTIKKMLFISPVAALLLFLLDGKNSISEVSDQFSYIFDLKDKSSVIDYVVKTLETIKNFVGEEVFVEGLSEENDLSKDYRPQDFIIKSDDIDLVTQRLDAPLDVNFIVTQKCNRNCLYCFAEKEFSPNFTLLRVSEIHTIFQDLKSLNINTIMLSGGEPFLRPHFMDIVFEATQADLTPFVSTKSYLSGQKCAQLKESGLKFIQVSIDSSFEETANYLTGSKSYFNQIIHTIDNLNSVGIRIKAKAVITSFNVSHITELLKFLLKKNISFIHLVRYGRSGFRHQDPLFVNNEELKIASEKIEDFKYKHPEIRIEHDMFSKNNLSFDIDQKVKSFQERATCGMGKFTLTILPDGSAFACEQLPTRSEFIYGDLKKQSVLEVWNSKELTDLVKPPRSKFKGQPCFNCETFDKCHDDKGRCMRDAFILFNNAYAVDPKCPKAPIAPRQV